MHICSHFKAGGCRNCPVHWKVPRKPGIAYKMYKETKPTGVTLGDIAKQSSQLAGCIVPNDDEDDATDPHSAD